MSDIRDLTARQAIDQIGRGALSSDEVFGAYRDASAADELNAYTWVADAAPAGDTTAPLAGLPLAVKDLFCTEGIPSQAGSKIL